MKINLHNKSFKSLHNSANGEVSNQTMFKYFQNGNVIWAEYFDGDIIKGFLLGTINENIITFNYQHLNRKLELMTGKCKTNIEILETGKIQLNEEWQWTCKDYSKGKSTLIEI